MAPAIDGIDRSYGAMIRFSRFCSRKDLSSQSRTTSERRTAFRTTQRPIPHGMKRGGTRCSI